jgi:hypothetical protein
VRSFAILAGMLGLGLGVAAILKSF